MRKIKLLSLLLCTIVLIITGCSSDDKDNLIKETPSPSAYAAGTEVPDKKQSATSKQEADKDFLRQYGVLPLPDQVMLPACAEYTKIKYLYRLNIDLGEIQTIASVSVKNNVMFCYDPFMGTDYLFSLEDGRQLAKVMDQGEFMQTGRLDDGGFWTIQVTNMETTFYDIAGNATIKRHAGQDELYSLGYVTSNGRYEIYDDVQGHITIYDLENNTSQEIAGDQGQCRVLREQGSACILQNTKGDILSLNPELAKLDMIYDARKEKHIEVSSTDGDFFFTSTYDTIEIKPVSDISKTISIVKQEQAEVMLDFAYGILVVVNYNTPNKVILYNLNTSEIVGEIKAEDNMQFGILHIMDNGFVLLSAIEDERMVFYLYDIVSERDAEKCEVFVEEEEEKEESNPTVKLLEETYGIDIYYGEEAILPESNFSSTTIIDEKKVNAAINALKDFLEDLPKGMTQEIYKDYRLGLDIYLCGPINNDVEKKDSISGYTCVLENGRILIAIDSSLSYDTLYSTIANAFARSIEYKIQYISLETGIDYLAGWNELYESDTPIDDRASLFEKMMTPEDGAINKDLDNEGMKRMARYYSLMLRACFKSCEKADDLVWEQYLGNIDKKEFSKLIKF